MEKWNTLQYIQKVLRLLHLSHGKRQGFRAETDDLGHVTVNHGAQNKDLDAVQSNQVTGALPLQNVGQVLVHRGRARRTPWRVLDRLGPERRVIGQCDHLKVCL
jgi:hypothetical protein